jgi:hypothetical protein
MRKVTFKLLATSIVVLFLANGCASFPQHGVPMVEKLPDKSVYATKPSVFLDVKMSVGTTGSKNPAAENRLGTGKFKEVVDKVARDCGMFSTYTLDPFKGRDMDYTIKLELLDHGNPVAAGVSGFISGLTLLIIPAAATDNYRLTATVFERDGRTLSSYEINDSVTTWIGIWFIPFMGNSPSSVVPAVWENMVKKVFDYYCDRCQNLRRIS